MKKKLIISAIVVIVVAVVVIGNRDGGGPDSLKLGLMLPLSGDYAVAGQNYQKGVELALEQYRAENPNVSIEIVVEDDAFDTKKGVSAYRKLIDFDHVDAIMMISTPVIDAIHEDVIDLGIPVIQLGIQTVGVQDDNIFQMSPSGEAPVIEFAEYLSKENDFEKTAVIYDNTAGGLTFFKSFEEGYDDPMTPFIVNSREDLRDHAIKITGEDYDAVIFLTSPENGALTVKEILTIDPTPPFFGFDAQLQTGFADYVRILGSADKLNGAQSLWLESGDAEEFQAAFKEKYGAEAGFIADFGYDIFNLTVDTYDKDTDKWLENIDSTNRGGVSGPISFDDVGVRIQPVVVQEVVDGVLVEIEK